MPRGSGFEFVDQVRGGVIPNQFIPSVEKGVRGVLETDSSRLPAAGRARHRL
jgi:elongation factor G